MRQRLSARWIFPVDGPSIERGTIEIEDGRVTDVSPSRAPDAVDLGNVALIPGLVNAHTHLEFSDLATPVLPAHPFTAWIRALVSVRRGRPAPAAESIAAGLRECHTAGTAVVGEILTATADELSSACSSVGKERPARVVAFREILGLPASRTAEQLALGRAYLASALPERVTAGLSPHAPYSVHPDLVRGCVDLCREAGAPLALHLAETRAELELLDRGTGEFVEMLTAFGAWEPTAIPRGSRPLDSLQMLAPLPRALVVHGNYLADDEQQFLADHPHLTVVYCPRTHAFFGHAAHPWRELLARGVSVAIGTDSRGSNPDLSLWRELQFLHERFPEIDPSEILELGTLAGARALGCEADFGTLTPGKQAAICAIRLPEREGDAHQLLFEGDVVRVD
ncbi:MAG TPA: amidohydrolase family protein [Planctomycetaceae bacterium]|nr:amidohydrolase family protein [Planctomycetaceae bacterium]